MNKVAVLIDAENISYKNAQQIMDVMSEKGEVIIKNIVADWTKITKSKIVGHNKKGEISHREMQIDGWRKEAENHSMTATQQFSYVAGKNTSDIALIVQAMKILYEKPFINTFCLVSNDSDFTPLAQELRMQNKEVVGMGERDKAIQEFVNAFSEFVYLGEALPDEVIQERTQEKEEKVKSKPVEEKQVKINKANKDIVSKNCPLDKTKITALKKLIEELMEEYEGFAHYSLISDKMKKLYSDFVPANFGCKNVSKLIEKLLPYLPEYEAYKEAIPNNPNGFVMKLRKKGNK